MHVGFAEIWALQLHWPNCPFAFSVYWTNFNLVKFVNVVIFKCKCRYQG
uniref:Uncharacterized protein n=1 Tax=Anguilla anguilla TaxID=7936 RepID=A0A0E9PHA3_ANGAN